MQALEASIVIQEARLLAYPALHEEVVQRLMQLLPAVLRCGSIALQGILHLTLARCLLTGLPSSQVSGLADRCLRC